MQKFLLIIGAFATVLCLSLFPIPSLLDAQVAVNGHGHEQIVEAGKVSSQQLQTTSCASPNMTDVERCRQLESKILATTLRLEITVKTLNSSDSTRQTSVSVGHATVVDGRFLVTHNHFARSPDLQYDSQLITLSAYRADGSLAIHQAPPHTFKVLSAGPQTLVFDFGRYGNQGAFDYLGLTSAQLETWQALDLRPGSEVAQVDWDGQKTSIHWVQVSSIGLESGVPVLQLDNYVAPGSSGGGVFYAGYHIANNWYRDLDKQFVTGKTMRKWTVAALNEANLIALATNVAEPTLTGAVPLPIDDSLLNLATADAIVR